MSGMNEVSGLKAKVTISRVSDDTIRIRLRDALSGCQFAEVSLSLEAFAYAVTGVAEQEAKMSVRGLAYIGKRLITTRRSIVCPVGGNDRDFLEKWLEENAQEEGWILNTYLGSQGSVVRSDGVTTLRYSVSKYVDESESAKPL